MRESALMSGRGWAAAFAGVALLGLVVLPRPASAEIDIDGYRLDGEVEVGWRFFVERPSKGERSKFEEYRHIPPGPFLEGLRVRLLTPEDRSFVELLAREAGEEDQNYQLRGGTIGLFGAEFEWDELRRVYSWTGRTPLHETGRGVLELDDSFQTQFPTTPAAARPGFIEDRSRRIDLEQSWETARFGFTVTPTPEWDIGAEWTRIHKEGRRPFGVHFGTPGGNLIEAWEPIDHTIHDLRVSVGFSRPTWQLLGSYNFSLFSNDIDVLVVDNPLRSTDSPTLGPTRGRVDLAPNNVAHTVSLTGAVNLPLRTRVVGTASYGIRLQDEAFIPHTINPTLAANPLLALPADSLDGDVRTLLGNVQLSSRPLRDVSLTARYRYYDFDNRTPVLTFPARVRTDQTLINLTLPNQEPIHNHPYSYTKQNASADLGWRPVRPVSLKGGYTWENWRHDRNQREVGETDEHGPRASVDVTPNDWLLLRTSYAHTWRDGSNYDQVSEAQLPLLRKYDMADRTRDRVDVLAQVTPFDPLTFSGTLSLRQDNYDESLYGLQDDESWAAGLDVNWALTDRVALFASYVHEEFDTRLRSRSRTAAVDLALNDWVSNNEDTVDTFMVGADAVLLPEQLTLRFAYNFSRATSRMRASNPSTPTLAAAVATDFPKIRENIHLLEATLRYQLPKGWFAGLRYGFELFEQDDFRKNMETFMGGNDVWLGIRTPDYTAHIISVLVGYRF